MHAGYGVYSRGLSDVLLGLFRLLFACDILWGLYSAEDGCICICVHMRLGCMRSSALKFLRLARGEAHVYPRFAPCSEWDTCAAHAILRAAGGEIYRWEDAARGGPLGPLQYNKPSLLNPSFVAVATLAPGEKDAPPPLPPS